MPIAGQASLLSSNRRTSHFSKSPMTCHFVKHEKNSGSIEVSMAMLVEVCDCQLLNEKADWKCGEDLTKSARVYMSDVKFEG